MVKPPRHVTRAVAAVALTWSAAVASSSATNAAVPQDVPAPVPEPVPASLPDPPKAAPIPAQSRSPSPSSFGKERRDELKRALDRYADDCSGEYTVSIRDLATGSSFSYNTRLRPATASVVKVEIVIALLLEAQRDDRRLSASERRLASQAIRYSDNAATDALWSRIGGGSGLARANKRLGLRHTTPGSGGYWGSTTTTATDQVRLLNALTSTRGPLNAANRRYVLGLMGDVTPEQAWGVSAGLDGKDESASGQVSLKNGWQPRKADGGLWTVNSIGRVVVHDDHGDPAGDHVYLIAVLSERHGSMGAGIRTVERVTELVTAAQADP